MSSTDAVAVVTVTYNSSDELEGFFDSLETSSLTPVVVVVVDNPSQDSDISVRIAAAHAAQGFRLEKNVGYGAAVNYAIATLNPEIGYILVANPDVRINESTVSVLRETMSRNDRIAICGPRIVSEDGSLYPSARRIPSMRMGVGHAIFSRAWPTNPWTRRYRLENEPAKTPRSVGWLSGSCFLVRRAAFEAVGGFDPSYFMYFEDVDLGYRLGQAGWINYYEPNSSAMHLGGRSTASAHSQMLLVHHRSADRFMSSRFPGWYLAPVRWSLHLGLELRARWVTRRDP